MGIIQFFIDFIKGLFGLNKKPSKELAEVLIKKEYELEQQIKKLDEKLEDPIEEKETLQDELDYWNSQEE